MSFINDIKALATLKRIPTLKETALNSIKYNLQPLFKKPFLPKTLLIYVTYRCNARCIFCGIWKGDPRKELSPEEIDKILSDRLFSKIEYLNINGGEPTLREDLVELIKVIHIRFPRLKNLSIVSNGLLPHRMLKVTEGIIRLSKKSNIPLSLSISVHGIDGVLDKMYGIDNSFEKIAETLEHLKGLQKIYRYGLNLNCVVTNVNFELIPELIKWSRKADLPIAFFLGELRERFMNLDAASNIIIPEEKKDQLIRFLRALSSEKALFNHHAYRYKVLADMAEMNSRRDMACHYDMGGLILGSEGELYYCPHSRSIGNCRERSAFDIYYDHENIDYRINFLKREKCPVCPPRTFNRLEVQKDILRYLRFLMTTSKAGKGEIKT